MKCSNSQFLPLIAILLSISHQTPAQQKSAVECQPPIVGMLDKFATTTGMPLIASSTAQKAYLEQSYYPWRSDLKLFPEIRSFAGTFESVNEDLMNEGIRIQLKPLRPPSYAVVSILKSALTWASAGEASQLQAWNGKMYPAVHMEHAAGSIWLFRKTRQVLTLEASSQDRFQDDVFLMDLEANDRRYSPSELAAMVYRNLAPGTSSKRLIADFPMVDFTEIRNLSQLIGIHCNLKGDPTVAQSLQETQFGMDELGVKVQSAVAASIKVKSVPPPGLRITIRRPFLLFIKRYGQVGHSAGMFLLAGYFYPDSWRRPAR